MSGFFTPNAGAEAMKKLVVSLLRGTKNGSIRWQEADSRGLTFIAKRQSGTVTISAASSLVTTSHGRVHLTVKDSTGRTVDELTSGGMLNPLSAFSALGDAQTNLHHLYELVRERVTRGASTVNRLADEFRGSD
jgi:hypothetical protein